MIQRPDHTRPPAPAPRISPVRVALATSFVALATTAATLSVVGVGTTTSVDGADGTPIEAATPPAVVGEPDQQPDEERPDDREPEKEEDRTPVPTAPEQLDPTTRPEETPAPDAVVVPAPEVTPEEERRATVEAFLEDFIGAHTRGDVKQLHATLHPSVGLAFGADLCRDYLDETVGSVTAARLVDVGEPTSFELPTPHGPLHFERVIPFTVEFLAADGRVITNPAHLPLHDGDPHWLTTCGVTVGV